VTKSRCRLLSWAGWLVLLGTTTNCVTGAGKLATVRPSIIDVMGPASGVGAPCRVVTASNDAPAPTPPAAFAYPPALDGLECTQTAVLFPGRDAVGGRIWLCRDPEAPKTLDPSLLAIDGMVPDKCTATDWLEYFVSASAAQKFLAGYTACLGEPVAGWHLLVESGSTLCGPVSGVCHGSCDAGK